MEKIDIYSFLIGAFSIVLLYTLLLYLIELFTKKTVINSYRMFIDMPKEVFKFGVRKNNNSLFYIEGTSNYIIIELEKEEAYVYKSDNTLLLRFNSKFKNVSNELYSKLVSNFHKEIYTEVGEYNGIIYSNNFLDIIKNKPDFNLNLDIDFNSEVNEIEEITNRNTSLVNTQCEIDRILDKISEKGNDSLTDDEIDFLKNN